MTTSSHRPFGFHAPGPMLAPVPLHQAPTAQAAVALPPAAQLTRREPLLPVCVTCGARRGPLVPNGDRYDSGAQKFICASRDCTPGPLEPAVLTGLPDAHPQPPATPAPEADAVRSYDALTVEAIAVEARAQERAEMRAELAAAAEAVETADWFHDRWLATAPLQEGCRAVHRLCAGRRPDDWLSVAEVRRAVEGRAPAPAPLTITWDGLVSGSQEDRPGESTLVGCTAALGGSAVLALDDAQRVDLAAQLLATVHPGQACATSGCGLSADDLDTADPTVWGWICVDVAGATAGARWWCSPACATAAMTVAGAELAAADRLAAITPDVPGTTAIVEDDVARCRRCGCTEDRACDGGCYWLPNSQHIDLCSACATPQELAYAATGHGPVTS